MSNAFIVPDLLTLLAVSGDYPNGFVGIGLRPHCFYCLQSVTTDDAVFKRVREWVKTARKGEGVILLFRDKADVEAAHYDRALGYCQGCGHRIEEH